jgi:hypothetical protein
MIFVSPRSREARDSVPAGQEEIRASFGKEIFAVTWTWFRLPFSGPLNFFTASGN